MLRKQSKKQFQNDATTQKHWQGSKQAIGWSSSSSPRDNNNPHATSEPWESTNNNHKRTRHRKLENGNFVTRAKALINTYQILMIAQHLEHPLDSAISNTIITLHSHAHPGCRPLQDFFRLRKRAKILHPEPEKGSTGFEIVTPETARATTQVWIRARFQLPREESSSLVAQRRRAPSAAVQKKTTTPTKTTESKDGRKKNPTQ